MSKRICIRACVRDIPGDPLARATTLGELFCQSVLQRPFQETLDVEGYDHGHIPPEFDSSNPVTVWFIYDLDVKAELTKEQLDSVPHYVYLASLQDGGELKFIPRDQWKEGVKKRAMMYFWGGRAEQQHVKDMRKSACTLKQSF